VTIKGPMGLGFQKICQGHCSKPIFFRWDIPVCGEYKTGIINRQAHTKQNKTLFYFILDNSEQKLHVSAHESHHQAYKYGTRKTDDVQLSTALYIKILCMGS
jgi:hypothetical protein